MVRRALLFFSAAARTVRCAQLDPATADRVRGAFVGALVADALSLATHYEYDATRIKKFYGAIDRYYAPGEKTGGTTHGVGWGARNFHDGNGNGPAKQAGEQTDYGDYLCGNQNFTARSSTPSTRRLLDSVVVLVPHRSTEPARPRHRREVA